MGTSFDSSVVDGLEEPVRRYLLHSIAAGAQLAGSWRVRIRGRIRVGMRLPFTAVQDLDGSSFRWRASLPSSVVGLLQVTDTYGYGEDGTVGTVLGRRMFADTGVDAPRSAATRAVMESAMVPATLLPGSGVVWEPGASGDEIRFSRPAVREAESVTVRIDRDGRAREVEALRWFAQNGQPGRLLPFRCRFDGEREFAGMRVPYQLTAGWVTDAFTPFYWARITGLTASPS